MTQLANMANTTQNWKPAPKSDMVSRAMRSMPESGTAPEIRVRRLLFRAGYRYRVQYPVPTRLRRTIDIAFPSRKLAIFIDGCFWHGCKVHRNIPTNNAQWWMQKIEANRIRDMETDALLTSTGWHVIRVWEHDDPSIVLEAVRAFFSRQK